MELKPTGKKVKVRYDGLGNVLREEDGNNPWATSSRGINPAVSGKRRRWAADTLGATPPRDGPFSLAAEDVAIQKPPKTRSRRRASAVLGGLGPTRK